ncbi:MAG: glycosyltransferase family 2 protein [Gemmatimonas sp.]
MSMGTEGAVLIDRRDGARLAVSVVIMTRDEERNVGPCIDSARCCDEIVVLDSMSGDATAVIARDRGARVVQRPFDDFATHKNWAIDNVDLRNEWVLLLDADERVTPELASEIATAIAAPGIVVGFYVPRRNMFGGRWIRHAGMYPDWNLRLFRRGHARYEARAVHEHMVLDGPHGFLRSPLLHLNDNKGIAQYIARHNRYSSMEAQELVRYFEGRSTAELKPNLFTAGPERRRALKHFAYRHLPALPLLVFLWMYVVKLGFLDGRAGLRYCALRAFYELSVCLKIDELRASRVAQDVDGATRENRKSA